MGWLKELAEESGFKSLRALAQAMRKADLWPPKDERDTETVANKLRDADKRKDLAFWTHGKGRALLLALAEVLHEEESDLIHRLQPEPAAAGEAPTVWPFKVFPALRPLDLRSEDPFPGVPGELVRRGGPRALRTWWVAPAGAGKALVGRWLEQRHGWTFLQADRWTDVELPAEGRVFVELASASDLSADAFAKLPSSARICVAAPGPPAAAHRPDAPPRDDGVAPPETASPTAPSRVAAATASGGNAPRSTPTSATATPPPEVQILSPPPPQTWAQELIRWAATRVKPGGGFEAQRLAVLLTAETMAALFATPGDLLGFLGMVDEVGVASLEAPRTETTEMLRWIRAWLRAALERPNRRCPAGIADRLAKQGPEILLDMEVERFRRGLGPALLEQEWIDLVPRRHAPGVDVNRLLEVLDEPASDAPARLRAVRAMLAPDGPSIVAGLKAIGALAESSSGRLRLRPAWVVNVLAEAVYGRLYEDVPDGLGSLLLVGSTSDRTLRQLIGEVREGELDRVQACVAEARAPSPEQMAALDGAFRAIGIALALGATVPLPLVRAAWERQMAFGIRRFTNWPPVPILTVASQDHRWGAPTTMDAWFLAAVAMTRVLVDAGVEVGCAELDPWSRRPEDREACLEALGLAGAAFRADEQIHAPDPLRLAVYRLGGALLDRHGVLEGGGHLLNLQGPDLLVALADGAGHELREQDRQELLRLNFGLAALEDACTRRSVEMTSVLAWCWTTWGTGEGVWPPTDWARHTGDPFPTGDVKRLWQAAPAAALSAKLCKQLQRRPEVWPFFTEDAWARWLEVWSPEARRSSESATAFRFVPEKLALQAVRDGRIDPWCHEIRRVLWERMPGALIELIDELARVPPAPHPTLPTHDSPLLTLVYAAPDQHCRPLIERARLWSAMAADHPGVGEWLGRWLVQVVERRASGWREAYELLLEACGRAPA